MKQFASLFFLILGLNFFLLGCINNVIGHKSMGTQNFNGTVMEANIEEVHLSGYLTLKGSGMNYWWSLTSSDGSIWRLEVDNEKKTQFFQWQNRYIKIEGKLLSPLLSIQRISVINAELIINRSF